MWIPVEEVIWFHDTAIENHGGSARNQKSRASRTGHDETSEALTSREPRRAVAANWCTPRSHGRCSTDRANPTATHRPSQRRLLSIRRTDRLAAPDDCFRTRICSSVPIYVSKLFRVHG